MNTTNDSTPPFSSPFFNRQLRDFPRAWLDGRVLAGLGLERIDALTFSVYWGLSRASRSAKNGGAVHATKEWIALAAGLGAEAITPERQRVVEEGDTTLPLRDAKLVTRTMRATEARSRKRLIAAGFLTETNPAGAPTKKRRNGPKRVWVTKKALRRWATSSTLFATWPPSASRRSASPSTTPPTSGRCTRSRS